MKISVTTENCDYNIHYLIEECADSVVNIKLEFKRIVSVQSRKLYKEQLCNLIQNELSKFKWLICGSVAIELLWFLHAVERQETDKVGDIDNITKPILDSLTGPKGILINDCQVRGLYTYWQSRNELVEDNVLYIKISFNNDNCLEKENLVFIQYKNAVCLPINVDPADIRQLFAAWLEVRGRQLQRAVAKRKKALCSINYGYLIVLDWEFHRTRLNGFSSSSIYTIEEFKEFCRSNGLTFLTMFKLVRELVNK